MRQVVSMTMALSLVLSALTGIGEAAVHHNGIPAHHIAVSALFIVAACTHGWLNRKPLLKYAVQLKWKWLAIAVVPVVILALASLVP